jgi:hypothetical protein
MENLVSNHKLGELYVRYYQMVKQSRNFEYKYSCNEEELRDIEHTVLYLLNHIATDLNQDPVTSDVVESTLNELLPNLEIVPLD